MSRLGSLSIQLIEEVFFLLLNLSLPPASSHLGIALSSPRVKTKLVLLCFSNSSYHLLPHEGKLQTCLWVGDTDITEDEDGDDTDDVLWYDDAVEDTDRLIAALQVGILECR